MKKIIFMPLNKEIELSVEPPQPAKKELPEWYNQAKAFHTKTPQIDEFGKANPTYKICMPFFDGISAGYVQKTWADIKIEFDPDTKELKYKYPSPIEQIHSREIVSGKTYISTTGYYDAEFTWPQPWVPKLPKGYSVIYTHPFNRLDLPFTVTTGIVDADKDFFVPFPNSIPFYIKHGWTGIIPAGTPMYQIIPIKRDSWGSDTVEFDPEKPIKTNLTLTKHFWGSYKKYWWQKKQWD
jgi:hypothetical protein